MDLCGDQLTVRFALGICLVIPHVESGHQLHGDLRVEHTRLNVVAEGADVLLNLQRVLHVRLDELSLLSKDDGRKANAVSEKVEAVHVTFEVGGRRDVPVHKLVVVIVVLGGGDCSEHGRAEK